MALTLEEFLPKARQLNPDYTDDELIQAYQERYRPAPTQTVSPAPLMTLEEFLPKARTLNPDYSDEELTDAWQEKYGARGARENTPGFGESLVEGATGGYQSLKASGAGSFERLQDPQSQWHKVGDDAAKAFEEEAAKHASPREISEQPWYQRLTNPEYLGKLLGETAVQSAPSLAGAMAGGVVGGIPGAMAGMTAVTYFQQAGSTYREAFQRYKQDGLSAQDAHAKAYQDSGIAGLVSGAVNALSIPASLVAPFAKRISNLFLQYSLNVGVDTADQITQNAVAQKTFAPERDLSTGVPEAVVGSALMSAPETMGGVKAVISGPAKAGGTDFPEVTERTPADLGLSEPEPAGPIRPRQIEGPIQPGEVRRETVYGSGPVLEVSPVPDVSAVTNARSLDDAIANFVGVVHGATAAAKARAAEFARMTAKAKNETDILLAAAPAKSPAFDVPTLPRPTPEEPSLLNQPSPIVPEHAFTPRPEPIDDPRARLAEEWARLVAMQEQRRVEQQANPRSEVVPPVSAVQPTDNRPLPSQIDLAYPSSKQVRELIHEKGLHLDTPVFREYLKMAIGKEQFADLSPQELGRLASAIQKIHAPQPPASIQEAPPQVPLTPVEPVEKPYAPVTTIPEAQVPRSELTPEKNAEILLRAEKAKADLEIAGTERGGRFFQEQSGAGSTQEVTGLKSATAGWYKELTAGPSPVIRGDRKQSAREKIEAAIQKIIKDEGADRGKAVEQVKAALLQDTEFHRTEWGRDLNSIMQGEWPEWVEKPQGVTQATETTKQFQNVPHGTPQVTVEVPKPKKVPLSRTERLAQQKQKMEATQRTPAPSTGEAAPKAEVKEDNFVPQTDEEIEARDARPLSEEEITEAFMRASHSMADAERRWNRRRESGLTNNDLKEAIAYEFGIHGGSSGHRMRSIMYKGGNSPVLEIEKRLPIGKVIKGKDLLTLARETLNIPLPQSKAEELKRTEPEGEPFSLSSPEVSTPKAKDQGPEQLSIDVPKPTVGERPIIGREAQPEEAPLFSRAAQGKDAEQTTLNETPAATQKEPWEMTRDEYSTQREAAYITKRGGSVPAKVAGDVNMAADKRHERLVAEAVAEDKPVPRSVLADYPALQKVAVERAHLIAPTITPTQSDATQSPTAILADALRTAADKIEGKSSIVDVGEKVGGARKDLVGKSEPKAVKPKPEGPAWERRYQVSQIVGSWKPSENGKWAIRDTKDTDFAGRAQQIGGLFDTEAEAKQMIPVVVVAKTHRVYQDRDGKWEIFKRSGDRKLIQVVNQKFDTEEDAKRYLAQNAAEILETKTFFGEEVLPRPETVRRVGASRRNAFLNAIVNRADADAKRLTDAFIAKASIPKSDGLTGIPLESVDMPGLTSDMNAAINQSAAYMAATNMKFLGNLYDAGAISVEKYGGLDIPRKRLVLSAMISAGQDPKIRRGIVELIPVDVMNLLSRDELTPDGLLRNPSMLSNLNTVNVNPSVGTENIALSHFANAVAEVAAKGSITSKLTREALESDPAVIAAQRYLGHGDVPLENVTGQDFIKTFGFRSIEFGNWQNQDDRQELMNHAYDGLHDLAETLTIPPRAIGLNGDLALAFGSRGHGLSGAAAHYERNYGVINLTKMQGAGHLAHEWFHAADHYFGRQDTKASSEKEKNDRGDLVYKAKTPSSDYASHGFRMTGSQVRREVREAYNTLIRTMFQKGEQFVEDARKADTFVAQARARVAEQLDAIRNSTYGGLSVKVAYGKRNTDPATAEQLAEFDTIAHRILEGETFEQRFVSSDMAKKSRRYIMAGRWSNDALEKISTIYKAVRGRSGFGSGDQRGVLDDLRHSMNFYKERLKLLADAQAGTEKTKSVPTSFAMEAKSMDQGRKEAYWATEHEMAARAFAAYVEDKLKADGKKSDFITYQTFGAVPTIWGFKKPYPEGAERKAINEAFDTFVGVLQTKETEKGIALYDERHSGRAAPTEAQMAQGFREGLPIPGTEQQLVDTSQEYPKELMRQLSTKRYVRQLTGALNTVFNAMKRVLVQSDPDTFRSISFAALSPDSYYYGVNDRGPDRVALNPWTCLHAVRNLVTAGEITEEQVPEELAGYILEKMIHEFTHQQVITNHEDDRQPYFFHAEIRNRAILGRTRLTMMLRQLQAVLTGGENGTVTAIDRDLTAQKAYWKRGDGLREADQLVPSEPTFARRGQNVSGEGASGRTGPPTDLRNRSTDSSLPLDESAGLRRSGSLNPQTRATIPAMATDRGPGSPDQAQQPPEPGRKEYGKFHWSNYIDLGDLPRMFNMTRDEYIEQFRNIASPEKYVDLQKKYPDAPIFLSVAGRLESYPMYSYGDASSRVLALMRSGRMTEIDLPSIHLVDPFGKLLGHVDYDGKVWAGVHSARNKSTGLLYDPKPVNQTTSLPNSSSPQQGGPQFSRRTPTDNLSLPLPGMPEPDARAQSSQDTGTIDPPHARNRLKEASTTLRPYLLGALGLEQLSQVYGNDHADVKAYNKAIQDMEADFIEMSRASDTIARAWVALKIPVADKMAQVMEDARFLNFDPDPKKNQAIDSEKKQHLRERFAQLPDDAQAVYRQARDFYTTMAEQRFQALKERIERAGGTPENTRKLVDRLHVAYEKVRSKVYFPFSRFGDHIVIAKQMDALEEIDREVHAFESVAEAQKFAMMMKLKGWQVKQTVAREYSVDKEGPASKIVRDMHDIIKELGEGQQGLPGVMNLEDQLLDSLNQSFLQALPDMSYAKHFIHAKDVKGASKDALRAFAHTALHGAHHISRIRHADKVTKALLTLDKRINETVEGDTTEARQVYNELVKRHTTIMNPNTHPVAAWLGQLGFTMSLGGVVATGITNATQVPLVTYPWLGARYGFGKASAALARAYRDFLDPRTLNKDSLLDATKSKLISESERKMLRELARRGHIDLTQTMDLAGLSSQDNLGRRARLTGTLNDKITRMLGFTFHAPEVMNRQVTALSTFRLEKEKGGSFEDALERAQQAIIDTHFIYTSENRPRYMQGNFLRVLTQFKQYSQNIAYTYGRAASIWLDRNNATREERTIAKRQLVSMLALQFGAAGALGMPFFGTPLSLLMSVIHAMGDDDEERDWEVAFRQWLDGTATSLAEAFMDDKEKARAVGKELGAVASHGVSRLTPWDMASRLGQADLFVREPQREREGRAAVMDWAMALGGPVPSYGVNFLLGIGDVWKGVKELNGGFFLRGVEELTPAVLRNGVKSLRYTLEGVRTRDEYKQLDLNTSEKLGQLFGFTPGKVAEMYESTTAVKNKEHRILNQQQALKDRFARAVDDQDDSAKQRILEDIRGFNERNPMFAITSNTLTRSLKARRQHEAGMERGLYLPPKRRALLEEGEFGDF